MQEFNDASVAPAHYLTHFSSAMIVAGFLIRLRPFTDMFLGRFCSHRVCFHAELDAILQTSKVVTSTMQTELSIPGKAPGSRRRPSADPT